MKTHFILTKTIWLVTEVPWRQARIDFQVLEKWFKPSFWNHLFFYCNLFMQFSRNCVLWYTIVGRNQFWQEKNQYLCQNQLLGLCGTEPKSHIDRWKSSNNQNSALFIRLSSTNRWILLLGLHITYGTHISQCSQVFIEKERYFTYLAHGDLGFISK